MAIVVCCAERSSCEGNVCALSTKDQYEGAIGGKLSNYRVETTGWVAIGDNLNGGIHAFGDVEA